MARKKEEQNKEPNLNNESLEQDKDGIADGDNMDVMPDGESLEQALDESGMPDGDKAGDIPDENSIGPAREEDEAAKLKEDASDGEIDAAILDEDGTMPLFGEDEYGAGFDESGFGSEYMENGPGPVLIDGSDEPIMIEGDEDGLWNQGMEAPPMESSLPEIQVEDNEAGHEPEPETAEVPPESEAIAVNENVLTIKIRDEVASAEETEARRWHEVQNAYRTRRTVVGTFVGIEDIDSQHQIAVAMFQGYRVVIPLLEMGIKVYNDEKQMSEVVTDTLQTSRILGNMLGAEIDFVVKGIDSDTKTIVASRKDAMERKIRRFYFPREPGGTPLITPGRIVQARVVVVVEKSIRVEVFGVEFSIIARYLSWEWISDAREYYNVGDKILVRVGQVTVHDDRNVTVMADVRSLMDDTPSKALAECRIQGKYMGTVTDIYNGAVYVKLLNGVNAVAHSCYDDRTPYKKDDVIFIITNINLDRKLAVGLISKVVKRNS